MSNTPICPWCDRQGYDICQHADDARTCELAWLGCASRCAGIGAPLPHGWDAQDAQLMENKE